MKKEWFASWFDSQYYHILYKKRNDDEAKLFINNIVHYLQLPVNSNVLDVACGKGRHSKILASYKLNVLGVDLSKNSIADAQQFETENLKFAVHDMRQIISLNLYDAVFNFFTSFGYFNSEHDNFLAAKAISASVKNNGFLLIDFLNANNGIKNIAENPFEEVVHENITFKVTRTYTNKKFCKQIQIFENDHVKETHYEQVNALTLQDFKKYFEPCNMHLVNTWGNYNLENWQPKSPRLIMLFKKNNL